MDVEAAKKLYTTCNNEAIKSMLEKNFGRTTFVPEKIQDRLKTFADVLKAVGQTKTFKLRHAKPRNKRQRSQNAADKIQLMSDAFSEGRPENYDGKQVHYYPVFEKKTSGWVVCYCGGFVAVARCGSGFSYPSQEIALYVANNQEFLEIYKDYLPE